MTTYLIHKQFIFVIQGIGGNGHLLKFLFNDNRY